MTFLEHYPIILKIQMILICISIICHLFNMSLVLFTKSLRIFAIRWFLYLTISQLIIFLPNLAIPYFTNPQGDPLYDKIIGPPWCSIQASMILTGWFSSSTISILIQFWVLRAIQGKQPQLSNFQEFQIVFSVYFLSYIPNIFFMIFGQYEVHGWHIDTKNLIYCYCQLKLNTAYSIFMIFSDIIVITVVLIFTYKIRKELRELRKQKIILDHPIVNIYWFVIASLVLWNINGLAKAADGATIFYGQGVYIIWQIINIIYSFEGIIFFYIFLKLFLNLLKDSMSTKLYNLLNSVVYVFECCRRKNRIERVAINKKSQTLDLYDDFLVEYKETSLQEK